MLDQTLPTLDPERIKGGDDFVEVYPMMTLPDGGAKIVERGKEPDFYDVWLRPDDWDDTVGDTYCEWDNLTLEQANAKVAELQARYPGICVNWVDPT